MKLFPNDKAEITERHYISKHFILFQIILLIETK